MIPKPKSKSYAKVDEEIATLEEKATKRLSADEVLRKVMCARAQKLAAEELEKVNGKVNGAHEKSG